MEDGKGMKMTGRNGLKFAANRLKCLSMNNLHIEPGFSNRAQSWLIASNRAIFVSNSARQSLVCPPFGGQSARKQVPPICGFLPKAALRYGVLNKGL